MMKKIDTWLDIQTYLAEAARIPAFPQEGREFTRVEFSEIADVRQQIRKGAASICVT